MQPKICSCVGGYPSTLVSSRNQGGTASCKTCGRPLVDGIGLVGSLSSGMMSTVGLELTNFLNPELTWKTVSKGNRSAPRRSRKPVARSLRVGDSNKSTRKVDNATVSETEELGVAVLGQRFSDKMEHIPIKKRKCLFRSPSPPPQSSLHHEVHETLSSGKRRTRATNTSTALEFSSEVNVKFSEIKNGIPSYCDFSGIEILAAVACNNSMANDDDHAEKTQVVGELTGENFGSFSSATSLENAPMSLDVANLSPKDLVHKDETEHTSLEDDNIAASHKASDVEDDRKMEKPVSSRDDRLHWDLNIVMDDWEPSSDVGNVDPQVGVSVEGSGKLHILEGCEMQRVCEDIKRESVDRIASSKAYGDKQVLSDFNGLPPSADMLKTEHIKQEPVDGIASSEEYLDMHVSTDLKGLPLRAEGLKREENNLELCPGLNDKSQDQNVPVPANDPRETPMCVIPDAKGSTNVDECLNHSRSSESNNDINAGLFNKNRETSPSTTSLDVQTGKLQCVESIHACEIDNNSIHNKDDLASEKATGMHDDGYSSKETMNIDSQQPLAPVSVGVVSVSGAVEVDDYHSPKCEDFPASGTAVDEQLVVAVDSKGNDVESSVVHTAEVDSSTHDGSVELKHKLSENCTLTQEETCRVNGNATTSSPGKVATLDPLDDSCNAAVYQDDKVNNMFSMENAMELQAGYDSQFEDGELRESDMHCWVENEGEDGEIEHVDYESEYEEERLCDLVIENDQEKLKVERVSATGSDSMINKIEHCSTGDALRDNLLSPNAGTLDRTDGGTTTSHAVDGPDGLDVNAAPSRMVGLRTSGMDLASHTEGSLSSNSIHRKDTVLVQRSRSNNFDNLCSRVESEAGSDKFMGKGRSTSHLRGRSPRGGRFINTSGGHWDSKRPNSPTYHGPFGSGRPRPKSIIESRGFMLASDHKISETAEAVGLGNHVRRVCRPLIRRRSPVDRDDACLHPGTVRDISPVGSRFRRCAQGVGRGYREESNRPMPDESVEYPSRISHCVARRERSISPHNGPYGSGRPRPKSVVESRGYMLASDHAIAETADTSGLGNHVRRFYRPLMRRRSPADRDDAYNMHTGAVPVRDISPVVSRFRRCPQGVGRGFREEYSRPIPDDSTEYTTRISHHLAWRERSISPHNGGRPHYSQSYKKSRSRSRSRSPVAWLLPRERNEGSRHRSRSPDFRSDARIDRGVRLSFPKRFAAAEYDEGYMSPPRSRFSPPPRSSRWFDDRNGVVEHFRGRKSPVRMFGQSQRFDSVRSMRRLNSDDQFRPMMQSRRFPDMAGTGRGCAYDENDDDRRKCGSRYEMIHRVRRYDTDGVVRGFRYNADDTFVTGNSPNYDDCGRGTDRRPRDALRRASEE